MQPEEQRQQHEHDHLEIAPVEDEEHRIREQGKHGHELETAALERTGRVSQPQSTARSEAKNALTTSTNATVAGTSVRPSVNRCSNGE